LGQVFLTARKPLLADEVIGTWELLRKRSNKRVLAPTATHGYRSELINGQLHEASHPLQILVRREVNFDPVGFPGSGGVDNRAGRMHQTLALDNSFGQPDIQFTVIVEVGERLACVAKGGESVISTWERAVLHAQPLESLDQLLA